MAEKITNDRTIIFYNRGDKFNYARPNEEVDISSAVICFPENFKDLPDPEHFTVRVTHMASYPQWKQLHDQGRKTYNDRKEHWMHASQKAFAPVIGPLGENLIFEDSFTPITIEKFTWKAEGAIYGSPQKIKDGRTPLNNCYIAGTDQGFLGIVGSMLSGVSIVNQYALGK